MKKQHHSAAILVIGNEILSGRTHEKNAHLAAQKFFECGCRLGEILVVPDIESRIVEGIKRLISCYGAVITSGGIGPTHDDITMQSVAKAFDVELAEHQGVIGVMQDAYGQEMLNSGRRRMARVPRGSKLIRCEKSIAPGVRLDNVYVLAGVPDIFASQLETILPNFGDQPFLRREIEVSLPESLFASELSQLQQQFPEVEIGSYPSRCGKRATGKICLSSKVEEHLDAARLAVKKIIANLQE
ncbi:MAG: competence/damage-inducible protein A [Mariprofundaceae bacterium]